MEMDWKARFIEAAKSLETPQWAAERIGEEVGKIRNYEDLHNWSKEVVEFYQTYPDDLSELRPAMAKLLQSALAPGQVGGSPFALAMRARAVRILADFQVKAEPDRVLVKSGGRSL